MACGSILLIEPKKPPLDFAPAFLKGDEPIFSDELSIRAKLKNKTHILMKMLGLYFEKASCSLQRAFGQINPKKSLVMGLFFTKICRYLLASKTYAKFVRR
jgi:hypothetical protein